ncbi:MAG: hypothetical protein NT069_15785 [Planctomycetota bacterium]|nr:hypothetical protein [Planctomycetota bacterium]
MKFFFDRCFPRPITQALSHLALDHLIEHHDDRFEQSTPDIHWLAEIGADQPKPIVISGDGKILRRPVEINALREQKLTFFVMRDGFMNFAIHEQPWRFLRVWPEILKAVKKLREPTVFEVFAGTAFKVEAYRLTRELPEKLG